MKLEVDPELVVPDEELSLRDGAVSPWSVNNKYQLKILATFAEELV